MRPARAIASSATALAAAIPKITPRLPSYLEKVHTKTYRHKGFCRLVSWKWVGDAKHVNALLISSPLDSHVSEVVLRKRGIAGGPRGGFGDILSLLASPFLLLQA
jgi:hypothetical protein